MVPAATSAAIFSDHCHQEVSRSPLRFLQDPFSKLSLRAGAPAKKSFTDMVVSTGYGSKKGEISATPTTGRPEHNLLAKKRSSTWKVLDKRANTGGFKGEFMAWKPLQAEALVAWWHLPGTELDSGATLPPAFFHARGPSGLKGGQM